MQPSTVSQEPNFALNLMHKLADFAFNSKFTCLNSNGCSPVLSNFACVDGKSVKVKASLSVCNEGVSNFRDFLTQFNSVIRFHCEKIPIGFASIGLNSCEDSSNGLGGNGFEGVEDEGLPLNGVVSKTPKKVLILMSDTGGGHRASAEAIKAAFYEEFGDEYQVFVTDLWTDHTPWPFNQLPRSYNFLVKHGSLWRVTYYASAPKVIHQSNFAATSAFIAREDVAVVPEVAAPIAATPGLAEPMDIMTGLQLVLKKSLAHGGLA